jgi:hypothetical protein
MHNFQVKEHKTKYYLQSVEDCYQMGLEMNNKKKRDELIKQIESLQRFYSDIGYDTENVRTIFALTLGYLREKVDKLVVKSFFEVLMGHDKLKSEKELNLLVCFDQLVDENPNPVYKQEENFLQVLPEIA